MMRVGSVIDQSNLLSVQVISNNVIDNGSFCNSHKIRTKEERRKGCNIHYQTFKFRPFVGHGCATHYPPSSTSFYSIILCSISKFFKEMTFMMRMMIMKILVVVVVVLANMMPSSAFTILAPETRNIMSEARCMHSRQGRGKELFELRASNGSVDEAAEVSAIKDLILSLSNIHDDEKRRANLSTLLENKLSDEDVTRAAQFAHLWDTTLIQIGGEIQTEARNRATAAAAAAQEREKPQEEVAAAENNGDEKIESPKKERVKSPDELQLWALVDMMVQSKAIIKKASSSSS